ncbi:DUF4032 domain-containing protein [Candidatus Aerophobetes bacterium]|uniref:DUF4032 domain-containing protein n=1 Tax=Aerophobetes bacterium TaxID=2030807 RepID=A0A662D553_UNCAE|nr:MAG: DUF4032 domain-containing protein [Candidatus Aerophobetes bacterium]
MRLTNKGRSSHLKYFNQEYRNQSLIAGVDLGFKVVEVDKIVGSVNRYMDFDANFNPKINHSRERFQFVKEALEKNIILPPVKLYKIKDEYYVVDGHHRVSVARQLGQKYIDAYVTEYLPVEDTPENVLYRARFDFEQKTGIEGILLSQKEGYNKLIRQIKEHQCYLNEKNGGRVSLREAAKDWLYSIYQPIVDKIKEERLDRQFKNATLGDIYVFLSEQLRTYNRERNRYIDFDQATKEIRFFAEEARILTPPERLRNKLMRILASLHKNIPLPVMVV